MCRELALLTVALLVLGACDREERNLIPDAQGSRREDPVRQSGIQPGAAFPSGKPERPGASPVANNAWALSDGQRLYSWMNCGGCHAHGGGAIGPPLIDDVWIYGGSPAQIHASIAEGRPRGMPSYGGHLTDAQIWALTEYVRSLTGDTRFDVTPSRDDSMQTFAKRPK